MSMAQISGQDGKTPLGVVATAIPAQQRLNRKTVTKVMQAGPSARIRAAQSNLPREDVERPGGPPLYPNACRSCLQGKARPRSCAKAAVPPFDVIGQNRAG